MLYILPAMIDAGLMNTDEHWMKYALREAEKAYDLDEAPIGAVIVRDGAIVGRGYNQVVTLGDPTAHAEIIAIGAAAEQTGYERLTDCTMYVTLEPCPMCAGAIVLARLPRMVYGAPDPKMGACGSLYDICRDDRLNHRLEVISGVLETECGGFLKAFFRELRLRRKDGNSSHNG